MITDKQIVAHDGKNPEDFAELKFCQDNIDLRRLSVTEVLYKRYRDAGGDDAREIDDVLRPHYLWFNRPDLGAYELRSGRPPDKKNRPEHLRSIDLTVDLKFFLERFKEHIFTAYKLDVTPLGDLKREMVRLLKRDPS